MLCKFPHFHGVFDWQHTRELQAAFQLEATFLTKKDVGGVFAYVVAPPDDKGRFFVCLSFFSGYFVLGLVTQIQSSLP